MGSLDPIGNGTGKSEPPAEILPIESMLSEVYRVASGDTTWREVASQVSDFLGRDVVLFVLEAHSESEILLGSSMTDLSRVPEYLLQIARRAGRRLKARVPPAGRGRFPKTQRHIIEEVAAWNSLLDQDAGYVTAQLLRVWDCAYLCLALGESAPRAAVPLRHRQFADTLLPHLARAAELERRLQRASAQFNFFSQILDRFPVAVVSLDHHGAVTHLNTGALRLTEQSKDLTISKAGVHAARESAEAQLQKAIAEAIADETGSVVRRLNIGKRDSPWAVVVMSLHGDGTISDSRSRCVLFIAASELQPVIMPDALSELLGLTTAEARIVAELAAGASLPEAAAKLSITPNTARTLLARATARTGTNSQLDIVRKVLGALALIAGES